jgi:hypothetical protein
MRLKRIEGADPVPIGAPPDWNPETHGRCSALFVRHEVLGGIPWMRSAHEVETREALEFFAGAPLYLGVSAPQHPVIQFSVGPLPPAFDPVATVRRYRDDHGREVVRAEMLWPGGHAAFAEAYITRSFPGAVATCMEKLEEIARANGWDADPLPDEELVTYAKVDGPPTDWSRLVVIDLQTGEQLDHVIEVNAAEGWAVVHDRPFRIDPATDKLATVRVEGRFEIRRRKAA